MYLTLKICLQDSEGGTIQCMLYSKEQKAAALECVQREKESVCLSAIMTGAS